MWLLPEDWGLFGGAGSPPNRRRVAVGATPDAGEQVTRAARPAESCSAAADVMGLFQACGKWRPWAHA